MDFFKILEEYPERGTRETFNPFAGRDKNGEWVRGTTSIDYLNKNYGDFSNVEDLKRKTSDEGFEKFFDYLAEEEKIPKK